TEGSGLYLAGPALVKAAIGQTVSHEELGGAAMHASVSGTIDFREPSDEACLDRLQRLVALLPQDLGLRGQSSQDPETSIDDFLTHFSPSLRTEYDVHDLLKCLCD